MELFKDKKFVVFIIIMVIFSFTYFIVANKISYAFKTDDSLKESYDITLKTIEKSAIVYATKNQKLFKDEKRVYIKVQDLINNQMLSGNADGNVINPLNGDKLNEKVIELKKENDKIIATIEK